MSTRHPPGCALPVGVDACAPGRPQCTACPSARRLVSHTELNLPGDLADALGPLRGREARTRPSRPRAGAAPPREEPGSRLGLQENQGSSFQSLLSCDPPLTFSSLFCFLFCSERKGGRGRGTGAAGAPGEGADSHHLPLQRASVSAHSVAQWHHPKGILMSLASSLAPEASRLFPAPWCQSGIASRSSQTAQPHQPEMHF